MAYEKLENSGRETRYVPWLAGSLPLAYYVAGARADGGLFEEGSFVAAARNLGVAHPPGAPLETLLGATFALLPVGPLSFRVSLASAVCAALTLALFARALLLTLSHIGLSDARCAGLTALAGSLWLAQTPLFFAEAVRPHVFASQFALSMLIIYTLLRFEASEPHGTTRVLYFGAFVQGLCFANHHVYGLLMLPLAAPTLGRVFARRGFIGLMGHLAAPLIGFSVYLYVPLRLAHQPDSGVASESGVTRMLGALGAEPYAGPDYIAPASLADALQSGLGCARPWWLAAGAALLLAGGWVSLRSSYRRRFGTLWLLAVLVPLASASLSLRPRLRDDAWGVLLPCASGLTAIACAGAGALLSRCGNYSLPLARAIALVATLAATLGFARHGAAAQTSILELADRADDLTRRELAADAILFTDEAGSAFHYQGREAEEQLRGDVTLVPLALGRLPRAIDRWAERSPELADSLRGWVLHGRLDAGALQSLSAEHAVYVEPGAPGDLDLYRTSLDEGLLLRVFSDGPTLTDLRSERGAQAARLSRLYAHTRPSAALRDSGLTPALGRAHLFQALSRAALGDREGARDYLELSRQSGFVDERQERLDLALLGGARIDLRTLLEPPVAP